jgi:hypothetical protein
MSFDAGDEDYPQATLRGDGNPSPRSVHSSIEIIKQTPMQKNR